MTKWGSPSTQPVRVGCGGGGGGGGGRVRMLVP